MGDHLGDRRLADARRTPQDQADEPIAGDDAAEERVRSEQVFLANDLIEGARAQPIGERTREIAAARGGMLEERRPPLTGSARALHAGILSGTSRRRPSPRGLDRTPLGSLGASGSPRLGFFAALSGRAGAKDGCADPDPGGPFFDRDLHVLTHAHRELRERRLSPELGAQLS